MPSKVHPLFCTDFPPITVAKLLKVRLISGLFETYKVTAPLVDTLRSSNTSTTTVKLEVPY